MDSSIQASRERILSLLDTTRGETRALLSHLDPERVVHTDERAWRVRDVIGHLGVWNLEAARSLRAHSEGRAYTCIPAETQYYEYNGPAAEKRRAWTMGQVWAEYDQAHEQMKLLIQSMPEEQWEAPIVYPWSERGGVPRLIEIMMTHEKRDHCAVVHDAIA
jgi:hypothetical protein